VIGLIVLAIGAAWLFVAWKVANFLASACKRPAVAFPVGVFSFAFLVILPFLDEIIGRWQFKRLCAAEAVVWVSPNAQSVVAAKDIGGFSERGGLLFPVGQQAIRYADTSSGEVFYSVTAFHTPGGILMRAGLGLGNSTSCWPKKWTSKDVGIDIDLLLKRGKS